MSGAVTEARENGPRTQRELEEMTAAELLMEYKRTGDETL